MMKVIYCILIIFSIANIGHAQRSSLSGKAKDTTVVGVLIATDSIFPIVNDSRVGTRYYYGIHHLKIGIIDIRDSLVKDTMILAYVYNIKSELKSYFSNFNMKVGRNYIFDLGLFSPCKSDFPKLEGRCAGSGVFSPVSNKLIKQYDQIYRVINMSKWNGLVKKVL
jgi:hypothetical protein